MNLRGIKSTIVLCTFILLVGAGAGFIWDSVETPVRGAVAVQQLEDSNEAYAVQKRVAQDNIIRHAIDIGTGVCLALVLGSFVYRNRKELF